jgi:site-specific DNA-methyltransferase (adenine-specific)
MENPERIFNRVDLMDRTETTKKRFGKSRIISGYDKEGKRIPSQVDEIESLGVPRDDVWDIRRVPPIKQLFPTQKPEGLLSRIIRTSSNEGDVILDPFCGCGTAVVVAQELNRKWIGIDITHLSINLIKWRLRQKFELEPFKDYKVIGEPADLSGAKELALQNRYQFQWWALSLINARPYGDKKKGADKGIDGFIYFMEGEREYKKVIVSVKSGKVQVKDIRDLAYVIERENAVMGIFLTLEDPTQPMLTEAITQGFYHSRITNKDYPKIQILTIVELFREIKPLLPEPFLVSPYKKAEKETKNNQNKIF